MSVQAATRMKPFFLMFGWEPTVPISTKAFQLPTDLISLELDDAEEVLNEIGINELPSKALQACTLQLDNVIEDRAVAAENIVVAQARQAKDYNRHRGITNPANVDPPQDLFEEGQLVPTREVNPNVSLKPGELPGKRKLRGTVRGPFKYVEQFSDRYCTLVDSNGSMWQKAYHDVTPLRPGRQVADCFIADFPVKTIEAVLLEEAWKAEEDQARRKRQRL